MKVALISTASNCGKTAYASILAAVYSRSQHREAVIMTTGKGIDNTSIAHCSEGDRFTSPQIFKSVLQSNIEDPSELYAYGIKQGNELVYIYDLLNMQVPKERLTEFFITAMDKIPARLTLIEICGDVRSEFNQEILNNCDVALILCPQVKKSARKIDELIEMLPEKLQLANAIVVSQFDPAVDSLNNFSKIIGKNNLITFPKNEQINFMYYRGELNKVGTGVVLGHSEYQELRAPMQDVMSFLFDDQYHKVIREVREWLK